MFNLDIETLKLNVMWLFGGILTLKEFWDLGTLELMNFHLGILLLWTLFLHQSGPHKEEYKKHIYRKQYKQIRFEWNRLKENAEIH